MGISDWASASVSDLTISTRARNLLRYGKITTVGQLARMSDDDLMPIPGMGVATVIELRAAVREFLTKQDHSTDRVFAIRRAGINGDFPMSYAQARNMLAQLALDGWELRKV